MADERLATGTQQLTPSPNTTQVLRRNRLNQDGGELTRRWPNGKPNIGGKSNIDTHHRKRADKPVVCRRSESLRCGRSRTAHAAATGSAPPAECAARAFLKIPRGAVFVQKVGWRGATKESAVRDSAQRTLGKQTGRAWEAHTPCGSSTEEQRSQTTFCTKTLRAAALLSSASIGSVKE